MTIISFVCYWVIFWVLVNGLKSQAQKICSNSGMLFTASKCRKTSKEPFKNIEFLKIK